jgi:asparagine synthase (glutamine-hydrolysing)
MCGVTGFFLFNNANNLSEDHLKKATNLIKHRGPDAKGYWSSAKDGIYLGHRRLSILDLSTKGNQPMESNCRRYVISFNGEIYNFRELALFLKKRFGVKFKNGTDTTVLLELISKFGLQKSLSFTEGMFALALWDKKEKKLFIARDRFGEKPIFYFRDHDLIAFSSELKVIKILCGSKLKICEKSSFYYSLLGYVPAPRSIFKKTYKVMPSEIIEFDSKNKIKKKRYYSINQKINDTKKLSYFDLKRQVKDNLENSIKKMMIADVEVGCFLSGGVDSSLVALMMQKNSLKKIQTFTVSFNEKEYNESDYAKELSDKIGTNHHELKVNLNDMFTHLEKMVEIFDEPFSDSSFIPTFLISKLASSKVKVVLSGDGGDEIFLGYNRYLFSRKINFLRDCCPAFLLKCLRGILNFVPSNYYDTLSQPFQKYFGIHGLSHKVHKLSGILDFSSNSDYYMKLNSFDIDVIRDLLNVDESLFNKYQDLPLIESIQRNDIDFYLPNDILVKVDRSSMINSLEVRSPFLNHKVVDHAMTLPREMKIKKNSTKFVLKEILGEYVSKSFVNRPKMGFAIPIERWINDKRFSKKIEEVFHDSAWEEFGWDKNKIIQKWENFKKFRSYTPQCIWMYTLAGMWLNNK